MSLKAWYPLVNGIYKNQGSCNFGDIYESPSFNSQISCLGATSYDGGHIRWTAKQTGQILNNKELSIAFWIYPRNAQFNGIIFGNELTGADNNRKFSLFQYPNGQTLHWSWMNDQAETVFSGGTVDSCMPVNKWTHVCITYKNPQGKIYINGQLKSSFSGVSTSRTFEYETLALNSNSNRYINDFRVYDNCLSPYEVHQLSKGLCCHYSFDGWAPTNEFTTIIGNRTGTGLSVTQEDPSTFKVSTTITTPTDRFGFIDWTRADTGLLTANTDYVFSVEVFNASNTANIDIRFEGTSTLKSSNYYFSSKHVLCDIKNRWVTVYGVFNVGDTPNNANILFYPDPYAKHFTDGYQLYRNIKLYKGSSYIENNLYQGLLKDSSGFGNNSTITSITASSDSMKGTGCGQFNANGFIACPKTVKLLGPFTVNIWAYMDNWEEYGSDNFRIMSCTDSGGYNIESSSNKIVFALYDGAYSNNLSTEVTPASLGTNSWHMFTFMLNPTSKIASAYIDGVKVAENTYTGTFSYNSGNTLFIGAEAGSNVTEPDNKYFKGKIDDFKLYGTCLSSADILDEYHTRAAVSSSHEYFSSSIREGTAESYISSEGVLNTDTVVENKYFYTEDGTKFLRIFNHDISADSSLFDSGDTLLKVSSNKESRLKDIPLFKDSTGKYEFLIRYPELEIIPSEYQEIEYIQSNSDFAYIDTNVTVRARWYFDITFTNLTRRQLMGYGGESQEYWGVQEDGFYGIFAEDPNLCAAREHDHVVHDFALASPMLFVNNEVARTNIFPNTHSRSYKLFNIMEDTPQYQCEAILYKCKAIDENNIVVRNYVPVLRKEDSKVGLFDLISKQFFTSATTNNFAGGPAVKQSSACLFNRWTQTANPLETYGCQDSNNSVGDFDGNVSEISRLGYSPLEISWTNGWGCGMALCQDASGAAKRGSSALLDCSAGTKRWWGAIGQYGSFTHSGNTGLSGANKTVVSNVELYIKITDSDCCYIRNVIGKSVVFMNEFIER